MLLQVVILAASIFALYVGAEFALDAAEKIGHYFGLSPLVIGLLLIGFGTSLPEMFVSHLACLSDHPGIALGNIVGSNIANLFLIMGMAGLLARLHIIRGEIKHQLILHVVLTALLSGVLWYARLNWMTGVLLLAFFSFYIWDTFREMKKQRRLRALEEGPADDEAVAELSAVVVLKLLIGFVLLYVGGEYLVKSGSSLAALLGISEYVVSAIFIAFGTSFPELVTALIACIKKKNVDLITGNIIGSNIFNVAFVMGSISFYNIEVRPNFFVEMVALSVTALFLLFISLLKKNFAWPGGILFLGSYGYMVFHWVR